MSCYFFLNTVRLHRTTSHTTRRQFPLLTASEGINNVLSVQELNSWAICLYLFRHLGDELWKCSSLSQVIYQRYYVHRVNLLVGD